MFDIYLSTEVQKFHKKIKNEKLKKILSECYEALKEEPFQGSNIRKMVGQFKGLYRYRKGNLRIVYEVLKEKKIVYIKVIDDRKNIYKK